MSCEQTNNCGGCFGDTPCQNTDCACAVLLNSDCVNNVTEDLTCSGIIKGQTLTEVLVQLDAYICEKFGTVQNFLQIVNVGNGAEIYKGVNNLGKKELRSLVDSALINVVQGTDIVTISIDETALATFIAANQKTYSVANIGGGDGIYKDTTVVGNNTQFNLKKITSSTLTVDLTGNTEITINTPASATIPALYVNNLYVPTYQDYLNPNNLGKGEGTLAKPFTDTHVINPNGTVASVTTNTAIQNALDGNVTNSYVGSGDRLNPQRQGQRVIIQNNIYGYTFGGDFNYRWLDLLIEGTIISTTLGYLVDMNNASYFSTTTARVDIELANNAMLTVTGEGFINDGNTANVVTYATGKSINFKGDGLLYSATNDATKYLFNSDALSTSNGGLGSRNDGNLTFTIGCKVSALYQGVYTVGGLSGIELTKTIISGQINTNVNPSLKAFHQTGGTVRLFGAKINLAGGSVRDNGFTFDAVAPFQPSITMRDVQFSGYADVWFNKIGSTASLDMTGCTSLYFSGIQLFDSPSMWSVNVRDNTLESISIDFTKVDLTQTNTVSSINTIGNRLVETLVRYQGRSAAATAGLPKNSAFLNYTKPYSSAALVIDEEYVISVPGTTNWIAIGADSNTLGQHFIASGTGAGTGFAYKYKRDVLI